MGFLIAVLLFILSVLIAVACNMLASELYDRAASFAHYLIDRAANRLPSHARERYREEWLAHLNDCPGKLSKLWHALGVTLSVHRVSREVGMASASSSKDSDLDVFTSPKKLRQLMFGLVLMLVGSLPEDIAIYDHVPVMLKLLLIGTYAAGFWALYSCFKALRNCRPN